jgi:hypothetical protein
VVPPVHPWFHSEPALMVTSHNGDEGKYAKTGTRRAFNDGYRDGYRWFQVDALPIKGGLVSSHSIFGRRPGYLRLSQVEVERRLGDVPSLHELLTHASMPEARWNIEMKSKRGLESLLALLESIGGERPDRSWIMISSPMRPSVLRAVSERYDDVALAAPVVHGGVFGVTIPVLGRLLRRPATPYACEQVFHPFVRRHRPDRPLRQAWTITNLRRFQRVIRAGAHPIVDSRRLKLGRAP